MIYLHWIGNIVLHIITLGLMYFTLKQFTIYISSGMTVLYLSEGIFYVCVYCVCQMKNKSKVCVAHSSEKCRPFRSSLASVARCITLQSAGQFCLKALVCRRGVLFCNLWSRHIQSEAEGSHVWMSHFLWCCTRAGFNNAVKHNDSPSEQHHDHRQ